MRRLLCSAIILQRILLSPEISFFPRPAYYRASKQQKPPPPPSPPKAPKKPEKFSHHGEEWEDPYSWMSKLNDKVAMRHMDVYMEQEEKYTEAVMAETERLQTKLQSEMASRMAFDLSSPPVRWGPWLYYRRIEEGKQYPLLCRRLATLNEEFISNKSPFSGFDFTSGKKIEQLLVDYNKEAERFGGYSCEEVSEVSPDHRFIAYTMYDKDNDFFKLSVRDLNLGSLCNKPQADWVSNLAWVKNGKGLLYVITDHYKRPCKLYCSMLGSSEDDVLLRQVHEENVYLNIRHTKDFRYVALYVFSTSSSKVYLIDAANPLDEMKLVWECEPFVHCILEHHQGYLYLFTNSSKDGHPVDYHYLLRIPTVDAVHQRGWKNVFVDDPSLIIEDVDFCDTHLVLVVKEDGKLRLCAITLPLSEQEAHHLKELGRSFLPLPNYVSAISSGPNYDYYSSTMRFTISSPVMPDATVDYDLTKGSWQIIQQQNLLHERTRVLYGRASTSAGRETMENVISFDNSNDSDLEGGCSWNDLTEFYACEHHDVPSEDGAVVPLTVVYSHRSRKEDKNPAILHVHGAYGEPLDKRWRSELKSLLDRGWVIAYADVRGGGGMGKRWHLDGKRTKKCNSIQDFIHCAKFLVDKRIAHEDKLAGWGYSAGGLLVASAINMYPQLFRAAILKVPFLDPVNTLLHPILPLTPIDYDEFGYPADVEDFKALQKYSPYESIQHDLLYPAVLVTSSFNTRFGVWEAAKWAARVRERTIYDPKRPVLLNLTTDIVEENRYLQCKELAMETAFLLKMIES